MYDYSDFHPNCKDKEILATGGRLFIICKECEIICEIEACSAKIFPEDIFRTGRGGRMVKGQLTPGHPRRGKEGVR